MNRIWLRPYQHVTTVLMCSVVVWAVACGDDDSSSNTGAGGSGGTMATGGSTSSAAGDATGGSTSSAGGATGGATASGGTGGTGGTGGSPDPNAGEYNHECLTDSPECLGGWLCKTGVCDFCIDNAECPNDDCNTTTFRCEAHDLCTVATDCPSNSVCDDGSCVFDHPPQGICGIDALYFAHDTSVLTPTYFARFTGAASCLVSMINGGATLTLNVYSDNIGSPVYNIPLTERRGAAVRDFLINQGASIAMMTVVAHGASQSTGIFEADRAADRRIDFTWN